ncbi:MAG: four helix bundle protein, partial [Myxococcota bacterium]
HTAASRLASSPRPRGTLLYLCDGVCRHASAKSCARSLAEGSGRRSLADKRRVYGIAHGELIESVACVEIDNADGGCSDDQLQRVYRVGSRLNAMLTSLTR